MTTHGSKLGAYGERVYIRHPDEDEKHFLNLVHLEAIVVGANVSISSKLLSLLPERGITCIFLDGIGRFASKVEGARGKNVFARKYQAQISSQPDFVLRASKLIVEEKIKSMQSCYSKAHIYNKIVKLRASKSYESILGIEGSATKIYFQFLKKDMGKLGLPFFRRSHNPPEDPANSLLSLAYTVLMAEVGIIVNFFDLDMGWGFLHRDYYSRDSLICDLMEPFRSIYADKYVLSFIKKYKVTADDFKKDGLVFKLENPEKKKAFYKDFREEFLDEQKKEEILIFVRNFYNLILDEGAAYFQREGLLG